MIKYLKGWLLQNSSGHSGGWNAQKGQKEELNPRLLYGAGMSEHLPNTERCPVRDRGSLVATVPVVAVVSQA